MVCLLVKGMFFMRWWKVVEGETGSDDDAVGWLVMVMVAWWPRQCRDRGPAGCVNHPHCPRVLLDRHNRLHWDLRHGRLADV